MLTLLLSVRASTKLGAGARPADTRLARRSVDLDPLLKCLGRHCGRSSHLGRWHEGCCLSLSMAMIVHISASNDHPPDKTGQMFTFHMKAYIS